MPRSKLTHRDRIVGFDDYSLQHRRDSDTDYQHFLWTSQYRLRRYSDDVYPFHSYLSYLYRYTDIFSDRHYLGIRGSSWTKFVDKISNDNVDFHSWTIFDRDDRWSCRISERWCSNVDEIARDGVVNLVFDPLLHHDRQFGTCENFRFLRTHPSQRSKEQLGKSQ